MGKGQKNILKIDTYSASLFYKQRSDLTTSLGSQIFNGASLLLRACARTVMILILMNFDSPMVHNFRLLCP